MKRGGKPNIRKHYQYIIENYDIAQLLKTIENKTSELSETIKLLYHLRHKVIEFYNNVFSTRVSARVIENHLILEERWIVMQTVSPLRYTLKEPTGASKESLIYFSCKCQLFIFETWLAKYYLSEQIQQHLNTHYGYFRSPNFKNKFRK